MILKRLTLPPYPPEPYDYKITNNTIEDVTFDENCQNLTFKQRHSDKIIVAFDKDKGNRNVDSTIVDHHIACGTMTTFKITSKSPDNFGILP